MATFEAQVEAFVAKSRKRLEKYVFTVLFDLTQRIVLLSPVDTGRFRGNWRASVGSKPEEGYDWELMDPDGNMTIDNAISIYKDVKLGDVAYLINHIPYGVYLEYGHSQQAPNGIIGVTLANFPGLASAAVASAKAEVP